MELCRFPMPNDCNNFFILTELGGVVAWDSSSRGLVGGYEGMHITTALAKCTIDHKATITSAPLPQSHIRSEDTRSKEIF
eukprot:gene5861-9059_t